MYAVLLFDLMFCEQSKQLLFVSYTSTVCRACAFVGVCVFVVASFHTLCVYLRARAPPIKANYTAKNFEIQFIFIRRVKLKRKTFGRFRRFSAAAVIAPATTKWGWLRYTLCLCL